MKKIYSLLEPAASSFKPLLAGILFALLFSSVSFSQIKVSDDIPQYLFNRFTDGLVVKKSGEKVVAELNYNIATQEMIFKQDGQFLALGNLNSIDTVYLNNMVFIPSDNIFLELAVSGKINLLVQFSGTARVKGEDLGYGVSSETSRVTSMSSISNGGALYNLDLPDNIEITRNITYYVRQGEEMERFVNERAFARLFRDKKKKIKNYIKDNNLDFDNYSHVVQVVKWLNAEL
ncbi:MAG: hypothetical protein K9J25_04505 [Bacteroidales bacterium]|nr:hypothetical protein [Bacteroidales bacterium]